MRGWIRGVAIAVSLAACSAAPSPAPGYLHPAIDPFLRQGYACTGPTADQSAYLQWHCSRVSPDGVETHVLIDGDATAIKNVTATIDQTAARATSPDAVAAFFDQVTDIDVGGSNPKVKNWVGANLVTGGHAQVDRVLISLGRLRPVDDIALFDLD